MAHEGHHQGAVAPALRESDVSLTRLDVKIGETIPDRELRVDVCGHAPSL
jgi:hypothetical protein